MALSKEDIINAVAEMSVMDVVELISAMEEKFGVSAAAAVAAGPAGDAAAVEEQSQMVASIEDHTSNIAKGADEVMQAAQESAEAGKNLQHLADKLSLQLAKFTLEK